MDTHSKSSRQLSLRTIILELTVLFSSRLSFGARWASYVSLGLCAILAGYTAWKDHRERVFDGLTVIYIVISIAILGTILFRIVV